MMKTKKKVYDEKLKKYQDDKSFDYSDEEFEDKDVFNNKFIDEDWEIALLVYPELDKNKKLLSKYSQKLSTSISILLIRNKRIL